MLSLQRRSQSGQTLLVVVLVMVVALTVVLSVVLRSVTTLRIATEQENSARAFSAAEAGIEQALKSGTNISDQSINTDSNGNSTATIKSVSVQTLSGSSFLINNGNPIEKDDGTDLWLVGHKSDGSPDYTSAGSWQNLSSTAYVTIYWGTSSDCSQQSSIAALEVVAITGSSASPISTRYALDGCGSRRAVNLFSAPDTSQSPYTIGDKNFYFRQQIDFPTSAKGILIRINPLYSATAIGIKGCKTDGTSCNDLPSQGKVVESVGISSGATRKVTFFPRLHQAPS